MLPFCMVHKHCPRQTRKKEGGKETGKGPGSLLGLKFELWRFTDTQITNQMAFQATYLPTCECLRSIVLNFRTHFYMYTHSQHHHWHSEVVQRAKWLWIHQEVSWKQVFLPYTVFHSILRVTVDSSPF